MQPEDHRHSASATVLLKASGFRGVIFIYLKDTTQRQIRILAPEKCSVKNRRRAEIRSISAVTA